tara:strand:+ start:1834 stop:2643 length:810 start_codon:yes stop_codon:yes gene_type:complete
MIFVTTGTDTIFELVGKRLIESFLKYGNDKDHQLLYFTESTKSHKEWVPHKYLQNPSIHFINIMDATFEDKNLIKEVEKLLEGKISFTDEYSSPRSVKWFRPVAAIVYAMTMFKKTFCSIDSDCTFIKCVDEKIFEEILYPFNVCYLGRKQFKTIWHNWGQAPATDKDTHTESGFIGFNLDKKGTKDFIIKNMEYWINGDILNFKYKTDCHSFDATVEAYPNLKYNNLMEKYGTTSPYGSQVLEASKMGKYLAHEKGMLGPQLYNKGLL